MNLDELSRLLEQATPGPWTTKTVCPGKCCWTLHDSADGWMIAQGEMSEGDAALIAALRNHAEELVRDARRLAYLESFFSPMGLDANGNHPWMCRNNPARLRGPNLRAAIDAAIAQEQP